MRPHLICIIFFRCNTHGQIGSDNREEAVVPRFLDLVEPIKYIASGANHNLAITGMLEYSS